MLWQKQDSMELYISFLRNSASTLEEAGRENQRGDMWKWMNKESNCCLCTYVEDICKSKEQEREELTKAIDEVTPSHTHAYTLDQLLEEISRHY